MPHSKVPFPTDKREWHPSLVPGAIALVSTLNEAGVPNVVPKSWIQMVSFDPPILMFSGRNNGQTELNIMATECFTLNMVDGNLAQRAFKCVDWKGLERIEKSSFSLVSATAIQTPFVGDSRAHLECTLHDTKQVGSGFVVFGENEGLVREHVEHLKKLENQGLLELCGPFPVHNSGMVILRMDTFGLSSLKRHCHLCGERY